MADKKVVTPFTPEEFYRRSYRQLVMQVRSRCRVELSRAEDIVQDVIVKVMQKMRSGEVSFATGHHAVAYCMTAARHNHINRVRRAKKHAPESPLDIDLLHDQEPAVTDPVPGPVSDEVYHLQQGIQHLSDDFRAAIELSLKEYSYAEIGERLGVPIGTVMSRLHRAKGHLREYLTRHLDPASLAGLS